MSNKALMEERMAAALNHIEGTCKELGLNVFIAIDCAPTVEGEQAEVVVNEFLYNQHGTSGFIDMCISLARNPAFAATVIKFKEMMDAQQRAQKMKESGFILPQGSLISDSPEAITRAGLALVIDNEAKQNDTQETSTTAGSDANADLGGTAPAGDSSSNGALH